jgi:hypothetical protein
MMVMQQKKKIRDAADKVLADFEKGEPYLPDQQSACECAGPLQAESTCPVWK